MKAYSLRIPAPAANVTSLILSIGTALRVAHLKAKSLWQKTPPITVEEIVQMDSPRMQKALKIVTAINACQNEQEIKQIERSIKEFNAQYPEYNPMMAFLKNKAWDVMACAHINAQNLKQMRIRQDIKNLKHKL